MANHGPVYGLDAQLAEKRAASYNADLEREAREWIEAVTGETLNGTFQEALKDGTILCKLANKISPGAIKKIGTGKMPFIQMENIGNFLTVCSSKLGVPANDLFQTVDLYEAKNMNQVIDAIHAVGRASQKISGFSGPYIGAKLATQNERKFTEAQLKQSEAIVPQLNKGSTGANAAGMYDTSRDIVRGAGARESTMAKNQN